MNGTPLQPLLYDRTAMGGLSFWINLNISYQIALNKQ